MNKLHYSRCPICNSTAINPLLTVKDHSVSKEEFVIWQCSHCSLRFTQDGPDQESVGTYYQSSDYISHSNTSKGLINKLYQKVRKHTLNQKAKLVIGYTKQKGRILDFGAGIGAFLNTMKEKGWEVKGIEPDAGARQQSMNLFDLEIADDHALTELSDDNFDAITLWHVLEHIHQLHETIDRLKALLRLNGKIFIAVPNYESLDASVYKLYWAAYDVPRHLYHFTPKAMEVLMKEHGLKIIAKKPMWFDSFYISLLSSRYKNTRHANSEGKPNWLGAVFNGLRSNLQTLLNEDRCSSIIYIIEKDQRSN